MLHWETNEPEWVDIWKIYDHFRVQEMTWWEWSREIAGQLARWKVRDLEREMAELREELDGASAAGDQDRVEVLAPVDELGLPKEVNTAETVRLLCLLDQKLDRITTFLVQQKTVKEWYSTADAAERLGKAEFTVREWCRLGHCKAEKKKPYRGGMKQWMIPHDELLRLESDGPAPLGTFNRHSSKN